MSSGHTFTIRHLGIAAAVVLLACLVSAKYDPNECLYGGNGYCLNQGDKSCPSGHKISKSICGFMKYCCYPYVESKPAYKTGNDQCGVSSISDNVKVVGGHLTHIENFPWTVSIQKHNQPVCGGSIINNQWILTAAHCMVSGTDSVSVVVGTSYTKLSSSDYSKRHYVTRILNHANFDMQRAYRGYDISLLKLEKPLDLGTTSTRSVCLPDSGEKFDDAVCVVSGWGYTHEPVGPATSSGGSPQLRQARLPILTNSMCNYYGGTMRPGTICAGYREGGVDACQGDSGGPLVCQDKHGRWKQAGIVSVGRGCARKYSMGTYTEVAHFNSWISHVMNTY